MEGGENIQATLHKERTHEIYGIRPEEREAYCDSPQFYYFLKEKYIYEIKLIIFSARFFHVYF